MYYNTTNQTGEGLADYTSTTRSQNEAILALFKRHKRLSPWQVYALMGHMVPITSIRRSITDLADNGKLAKTGEMIPGNYGRSENIWEVSDGQHVF